MSGDINVLVGIEASWSREFSCQERICDQDSALQAVQAFPEKQFGVKLGWVEHTPPGQAH